MAALLLTSWTCVMTWGGGLLALRLEAYRAFVFAFAAGALVASALVDVIPDALELLEKSGTPLQYHQLLFACCMGFLAFYLLEQVTHNGIHAHDPQQSHASQAGLLGATGSAFTACSMALRLEKHSMPVLESAGSSRWRSSSTSLPMASAPWACW